MDLIPYRPTLLLKEGYVADYKIYVLKNPYNGEVFYVGQTLQELQTRLSGHIHETGASNREKKAYIKRIIDSGSKPIIEPLEVIRGTCYIDKLFVNQREIFWIKHYKSQGKKLLNIASSTTDADCTAYKSYLRLVKAGQPPVDYYYCGETYGGQKVYDEEKLKADGFKLSRPETPIVKLVEKVVERVVYKTKYIERENVKTVVFPEQPGWTPGFLSQIPHESIFDDLEEEATWDDEPDSDYEPEVEENDESDLEEDHENEDESDFY